MENRLVNATVPTDATRFDLKSVEGGWVELKPLPYGQLIERRDKASRMSMAAGGKGNTDTRMDIDMLQAQSRIFEFQHCVVDHNLSDDHGTKLNFSNPSTLGILDPKVGQEVEQLIDDLNQLEEIDEDLFTQSHSSSTGGTLTSQLGKSGETT